MDLNEMREALSVFTRKPLETSLRIVEWGIRQRKGIPVREHLLELLHREPFAAFRVVLTSGKEYEVTDPQLVAVGQTEITIYIAKSDRWVMLRLSQVASFESAQPA